MTEMHNPPHPGLTLRDDVLPTLKLSVEEAAAQLHVEVSRLYDILDGHAPIDADFALRLEAWLSIDRGGRAGLWLERQLRYDLWQARKNPPQGIETVELPWMKD